VTTPLFKRKVAGDCSADAMPRAEERGYAQTWQSGGNCPGDPGTLGVARAFSLRRLFFDDPWARIAKGPVAAFITLEAFDGLLTMWAINHGFTETNPLTGWYADSWLFPTSKIAAAMLAAVILRPAAKRFPLLVSNGFVAASVFVGVIIMSNLYEVATAAI